MAPPNRYVNSSRKITGCRVTSIRASGVRMVLIRLRRASATLCRSSAAGAPPRGLSGSPTKVRTGTSYVVMLCPPLVCPGGPRVGCPGQLRRRAPGCRRSHQLVLPGGDRGARRALGERVEHLVETRQVQGQFGDL